ncbi:MAG: tetratricopeptide repeat protein [Candidatus Omnitrophota bacterium]
MPKNKYLYLILVAACFLIYANSLNNAFVSDDIPAIVKNPLISSPLRFWLDPNAFSCSLNYLMGQYNPFIYHLTNIILHSLNAILVFFFLRLFFQTQAAFWGTCLFAVHPIHTEAATWVSGRPYIILSLFILGAYFLYQKASGFPSNEPANKKNGESFRSPYYIISLLVFTYFIIQHISFYFLFPFFLILSDVTFGKWRKNWKLWLPYLGIVILRLIVARVEVMTRVTAVAKEIGTGITWTNPFFNLVYSFFSHAGLVLWPDKLTLYHEPAIISSFALKIGIAVLLLLLCSLPFIFRRTKEIFFAIVLFILFLAPTYSPVMVSWLVAERYVYFPSVALSIMLSFSYEKYLAPIVNIKKRNFFIGLLIFIISGYAVRTVIRNEDWKSPERFWRQTVLVSPDSPRSHNNMGDVYSQEGNVQGAIKEFTKAIEIKPDYADAYHNLATTYYSQGNVKEAIKLYEQGVSLNPELFESHFNLGVIYLDAGRVDLAVKELQEALRLRPEDAAVRQALNLALARKK